MLLNFSELCSLFGQPFVKWFALCYRTIVLSVLSCLYMSVLSVHDIGVLLPNGWMDQDETWRGGSSRRWARGPGHIVLDGDLAAHPSPQFSAHVCCGQMAGWINMPLGMELGLC